MNDPWPRRIFFLLVVAILVVAMAVAAHNIIRIHDQNTRQNEKCYSSFNAGDC